jgi:glycylpeptide N-tetradecanoyltransferase
MPAKSRVMKMSPQRRKEVTAQLQILREKREEREGLTEKQKAHEEENNPLKAGLTAKEMKKLQKVLKPTEKKYNNDVHYARNEEEAHKHKYKFWDTQPVPSIDEDVYMDGKVLVDKNTVVSELQSNLPEGLAWSTIDLENEDQIKELVVFLGNNYIEDDTSTFSVMFTKNLLLHILQRPDPSGSQAGIYVAIKDNDNNLIGFIYGMLVDIRLNGNELKSSEISLLCVDKAYRVSGLAPLLIKEATRLINQKGVYTSIYTGERYLPKPISKATYYHRPLNINKLLNAGFLKTDETCEVHTLKKYFEVNTQVPDLVSKMTEEDIDDAYELYMDYIKKYSCHEYVTKNQFKYMMFGNKIVHSYIIKDDEGYTIDFFSFVRYTTNVKDSAHRIFRSQAYYYSSNDETIYTIMGYIISLSKELGCDVVDIIDIHENGDIVDSLKFDKGTGELYYYFYNWKTPYMEPFRMGKMFIL